MSTLIDEINTINTRYNRYNASDPNWRQYVIDHRQLILNNSTDIPVDPNLMNTYTYRIRDFLTKINTDPAIDWIVLYINQLFTNENFVDVKKLFIPSVSFIDKLYMQYQTNITNKNN